VACFKLEFPSFVGRDWEKPRKTLA
jgi:hypothetical protein